MIIINNLKNTIMEKSNGNESFLIVEPSLTEGSQAKASWRLTSPTDTSIVVWDLFSHCT